MLSLLNFGRFDCVQMNVVLRQTVTCTCTCVPHLVGVLFPFLTQIWNVHMHDELLIVLPWRLLILR